MMGMLGKFTDSDSDSSCSLEFQEAQRLKDGTVIFNFFFLFLDHVFFGAESSENLRRFLDGILMLRRLHDCPFLLSGPIGSQSLLLIRLDLSAA